MNGIPFSVRRTVVRMAGHGGKTSIAGPRSESLRALIRAITATDHGGVQRRTASALGLAPSTLNGFMNGANGASLQVIDALKAYLQRTEEEIVSAAGDLAALRRPRVSTPAGATEVRFGSLPMWPELLAGAKALDPNVPEWAWRDTAESVVWVRAPITSMMIVDVARFLLRHIPPHA